MSSTSSASSTYDSDFELTWSIFINTFNLKPLIDTLSPDEIAKFKQYFHDEDKENLNKLVIQLMEKYGSTK